MEAATPARDRAGWLDRAVERGGARTQAVPQPETSRTGQAWAHKGGEQGGEQSVFGVL